MFDFSLWDFRNTIILEMKRKEFIRHNDNLYLIIEIYTEQRVKPGKTQELRELLGCDIVLRKDGLLLFCEKIQEAEVIS